MSEFILKDESFGLRLLDKIPVPEDEECFLLYHAGGGRKESVVINEGDRYSSAEVRHGHYNRKATISLKAQSISHS